MVRVRVGQCPCEYSRFRVGYIDDSALKVHGPKYIRVRVKVRVRVRLRSHRFKIRSRVRFASLHQGFGVSGF